MVKRRLSETYDLGINVTKFILYNFTVYDIYMCVAVIWKEHSF
jgi:hypothetical protein